MDNVMIELWVPATGQLYDIKISRISKIYVVQRLIASAIDDLSAEKYHPKNDAVLCDRSGRILDVNMTVEELGLKNGAKLMLI